MAMQEDPEWRRVLLLLTAIVLLIAMAATGTMFLRLMGTDTDAELDMKKGDAHLFMGLCL